MHVHIESLIKLFQICIGDASELELRLVTLVVIQTLTFDWCLTGVY